jgi:hypothetical protein
MDAFYQKFNKTIVDEFSKLNGTFISSKLEINFPVKLELVDMNLTKSTEILNFFRKENAQINLEEEELDETFKANMDKLKAKFEHDKKTMVSSKAQEQAKLASRKMVATANEEHYEKGVRKWSNQKKHADNELQFLEWI